MYPGLMFGTAQAVLIRGVSLSQGVPIEGGSTVHYTLRLG